MAKPFPEGAHQGIIQRLLDAEREARELVRKAREEGEEIIETAQREADEQLKKTLEAAQAEAEDIVGVAGEHMMKAKGGAAAGIGDIDTLRRQAEENMEKAVRFLVGRISEPHHPRPYR